MSSLGLLYEAQGKLEEAEQLLTQVLEARRRVLGEEHSTTLASIYNLAELYRRQNRQAESKSLLTQLLEARRRVLGPDHLNTTNTLDSLGRINLEQGKYAEAQSLLRQSLDAYNKKAPDTWRRYYAETALGATLTGLGEYTEAEALLISGYEGIQRRLESIPAGNREVLNEAREWIVALYRAQGQPEKAHQWAARLPPPIGKTRD